MEVEHVHETSYDFSVFGLKCFMNGCCERVFRMIQFDGDTSKIISVFGMRNLPKRDGYLHIGFCIEHRNHLHLLGYMMAYHEQITLPMVRDIDNAFPNQVFDAMQIYRRLNFIKQPVTMTKNGASLIDICRYTGQVLLHYVCSEDIVDKLDVSKCAKEINNHFTLKNHHDAMSLFMSIKKLASKLHDKSIYLRYGAGYKSITDELLQVVSLSNSMFTLISLSID